MYPGSLMKIFQTLHSTQRFCQFHHIILHFGTYTTASTAIVEVSLIIIIHKDARVYHGKAIVFHSYHVNILILYGKVFGRMLTGSYTHSPGIVPVITTRVRKVKIISTIPICTIGCPHEATIFTSPRHLRRVQYFTMICPVNHVICREYMIAVH